MLTISSVIGIFVFLLIQVVPLASGARVDVQRVLELGLDSPQVVLVDEYLQHVVLMDGKGRYSVRTTDGSELLLSGRMPLEAGEEVTEVSSVPEQYTLTAATSRGRVLLQPFSFEANYGAPTGEEGLRSVRVEASVLDPIVVQIDPRGRRILTHTAHVDEVGGWSIVAQLEDKTLRYLNRGVSVNPMTEEETVTERVLETVVESRIDHVLLSGGRPRIFAALEDGPLVWWELRRERFGAMRRGVQPDGAELVGAARVTAMSMLLGGESVIVGRADGGVSVWFPVRVTEDRNDFELTEVHRFDAMTSAVLSISASRRNRSFVCLAQDGGISLCYATTADVDWSGRSGLVAVQSVALSPKSDALVVAGADSAELYSLDNPHPELSMGTLFGKVWYEGAREPSYEWQSTGGSQAYERKLSFVPLIWGTLKGTLFSLLLSLPIAVFSAIYVSQFMSHGLRRYIKPIIELMAAIPSVVLGFMAAFWLLPHIEAFFTSLLLMMLVVPAAIVLGGFAWLRVPAGTRQALPQGIESLLMIGVILLAGALCLEVGGTVESWLFRAEGQPTNWLEGDYFLQWLSDVTGTPFEQRNALLVGFAMSFAVIPIIFSISEEAFSNVPKTLVSGSLALGADRWQTVTRIILPTASPGIFSAAMIGFGRAVGETMIVLMATGNTAIMDWNPFNGFLALSANIAFEIGEADVGSTHYRALFLSGLVLFAFTFMINSIAEFVRHRLRRRYATL